jgi:hypothetical protein
MDQAKLAKMQQSVRIGMLIFPVLPLRSGITQCCVGVVMQAGSSLCDAAEE